MRFAAVLQLAALLLLLAVLADALELPQRNSGRRANWRGSLNNEANDDLPALNVGLILPYSIYNEREYIKAVTKSLAEIARAKRPEFEFLKNYRFGVEQINRIMMIVNPSPTEILRILCDNFLQRNVSSIMYLTNSELFGRSTASSQYFLQLAGYLGIPVVAWNADNSGLERRSQARLHIQLAPSVEHQVAAMLSILVRYNWQKFSVVTSEIAGHDDFIQAVRDRVALMREQFSFSIQCESKVVKKSDLRTVKLSETRILLLYSTQQEGSKILKWASELGITGKGYVWIATQSVIGHSREAMPEFHAGMLGVSFDTGMQDLIAQIPVAMQVVAHAVEAFVEDHDPQSLVPRLSCQGDAGHGDTRWDRGEQFHRYLRNVTIRVEDDRPNITFLGDGTLRNAELKIMNLREGGSVERFSNRSNKKLEWEEIGKWRSFQKENNGLDIKDIVWPGQSHVPPQGVPEKFHLTVGFLEEPPFINLAPPDPVSGKCNVDRGVPCRIPRNQSMEMEGNATSDYEYQCCSGFCIDLLAKFANDLQFEYDLIRVKDARWGVLRNGKWNGLMSELVAKEFDMALTALKVNAEREAAVDFTAPFLETGTTILVAKRTGIVSPMAFLEPFDAASWLLVVFAAVQVSALTIFLFEWLSPAGYDMKTSPSPDHKFSLLRTYWMVWALLLQAPVNMDCPRAFTARFMASVWALFAVVFLAIYTASLAAFMITREEWDTYSGLDDPRLSNPMSVKPALRFGTVPYTYTDEALRKHFPEMHEWMQNFVSDSEQEGIVKVKRGELDAFIYDGSVLQYLVAQDEECKLLTVGTWYAMTGYGLAFPRNSKHFESFNKKIMDYSESGDLERLRRFWLTGMCNPKMEEKKGTERLAPEQFLSAFFLLFLGILFASGLVALEHAYIKWGRHRVAKTDKAGCFALLSQSMGKSLTFRGTVFEASALIRTQRCQDPACDTGLIRVKQDLDLAKAKLRRLESELRKRGVEPEDIIGKEFNEDNKGINWLPSFLTRRVLPKSSKVIRTVEMKPICALCHARVEALVHNDDTIAIHNFTTNDNQKKRGNTTNDNNKDGDLMSKIEHDDDLGLESDSSNQLHSSASRQRRRPTSQNSKASDDSPELRELETVL